MSISSKYLIFVLLLISLAPHTIEGKAVPDSLRTEGMRNASSDIRNNNLAYKCWGLPTEGDIIYEKILKERYNVKIEYVSGDIALKNNISKWEGYNTVIRRYVTNNYGYDIFQKSRKIANNSIPGTEVLNKDSVLNLLQYPKSAREKKIEGIVAIDFKITKYGKVTEPQIIKSLGYGCDKEALRLLKFFRFRPANNQKYANDKTTYNYSFSFKFNIK